MAKPRSSTQSKAVTGTLRPERISLAKVPALKKLPPAPSNLTEHARIAWNTFGKSAISLGTMSEYDTGLLELLSRTWGSCVELEALLAKDGHVLVSGDVRKAHPALQALDRARALAHRMLGDLALTPPGRERITIDPHQRERRKDPAEKYFA